MSSTISLDISVAIDGGTPVSNRVNLTAEQAFPTSVTVPALATAFVVSPVAIDLSQLKFFELYSAAAMTIKTNDSGSPDDTLTLVAGKPTFWYEGCGWDCQITADVDSLYVASTDGGVLTITIGQDVTP